ncbi:MAG: hypothetical protein QOE56_356 [Solirubrobacterales bacterium]|nr:hypothetical protein [Solirubrobacterales bacterium]
MRFRLPAAVLVALLGLTLALPAGASAAERVVSVSADATVKVRNDSASFGFSVVRERRKRGGALRAASSKLRAVIAAVQGVPGVGPGDVTTGRVSIRKAHRGHRVYWRVSQGIGVTLHEVDQAGELIGVALGSGASGVSGPNYFVSNTGAAFGSALAKAFEVAKNKATALATQAGSVLGPAVSIDEGEGAEFLAPNSDQVAAPKGSCVTGSPNRHAKASQGKLSHSKRSHANHPKRTDAKRALAKRAHARRARDGRAHPKRAHPRPAPRVSGRCTTSTAPTKPGASRVTAHVHVVFELR